METLNRIKEVFNQLKKEGKHITIDTMVNKSLFSSGGTLAGHEEQIGLYFWEIKNNIEREVKRNNNTNEGVIGLAVGFEINAFFNEPITTNFLNNN